MKQFFRLDNKWFVGTLFSVVFFYLLLRALLNEPLHDEIATFYFYIYHGDFIGRDLVCDANNHLLNSFLGHVIYKLFGENFFLFRVPNLLSFIVYFFSVYSILKPLKQESLKVFGLISLVSIPFMIEYFAYTRGYGIGIAFFTFGISHAITYISKRTSKSLVYLLASFWIAVFANLIFLNSCVLILGFLFSQQLASPANRKWFFFYIFFFCLGLVPFVFFGFQLKNAGALYYGSLSGLWEVTGKSLSEYVLFNKGYGAFIVVSVLIFYLLFGWIKTVFENRWSDLMGKSSFLIGALLFGNLAIILVLAFVLKVNYPEDRTGMYLIPLVILLFVFYLDEGKYGKWVQWTLLFFPISFLFHLSLHSSIYSPDQRTSMDFYRTVKSKLRPDYSISSYHMNIWTWNYCESFAKNKSSVLLTQFPDFPISDIILVKKNTIKNPEIVEKYDTIAVDLRTHDFALKRKIPLIKKLVFSSSPVSIKSDFEYTNIYESDSLNFLPQKLPLQITVECEIKMKQIRYHLDIVVQTFDKDGNQIHRINYPIGFINRNKEHDFIMKNNFVLDKLGKDVTTLKVYVWNKGLNSFELKNGKCYIYEVLNP